MVSAVSRPQESRFPSASSGPGAGMCSYVQLICALTKSTEACWVQKHRRMALGDSLSRGHRGWGPSEDTYSVCHL